MLFIKYLNKKDIEIIITKGKISFIIDGILNKLKENNLINFDFHHLRFLAISIKLINKTKLRTISKLINKYLLVILKIYKLILFTSF